MKTIAARIALAVAIAWAAAGCAGPVPDLVQEMPVPIEKVETPDDHLAIAAHFENEAARARAGAASHRRMARAYSSMRSSEYGNVDMAAHCNSLADMYDSIAADFDHLALGHRDMAKHAAH